MPRKQDQQHVDLRKLNGPALDKWSAGLRLEGRGSLTWKDAPADLLRGAIAAATEDGAGLLFSKTSDGGALTLYVLHGGATNKLYPTTSDELRAALQLIVELSTAI